MTIINKVVSPARRKKKKKDTASYELQGTSEAGAVAALAERKIRDHSSNTSIPSGVFGPDASAILRQYLIWLAESRCNAASVLGRAGLDLVRIICHSVPVVKKKDSEELKKQE